MEEGWQTDARIFLGQLRNAQDAKEMNRLANKSINIDWNPWPTNAEFVHFVRDEEGVDHAGALDAYAHNEEHIGIELMQAIARTMIPILERVRQTKTAEDMMALFEDCKNRDQAGPFFEAVVKCMTPMIQAPPLQHTLPHDNDQEEEDEQDEEDDEISVPKRKPPRRHPTTLESASKRGAPDVQALLQHLRGQVKEPAAAAAAEMAAPVTLERLEQYIPMPSPEYHYALQTMLMRGNYITCATALGKPDRYIAERLGLSQSAMRQSVAIFKLVHQHGMHRLRHVWPDRETLAALKKHATRLHAYMEDHPEERQWWSQQSPPRTLVITNPVSEQHTTAMDPAWLCGE